VVEAIVVGALGLVTGGYTVVQAMHRRVNTVDTRLDKIEITLARDYVPRAEFMAIQEKLEEHMLRIEQKLDRMLEQRR
jgi:bacterioferritin (cytochrome b1)